MIGGFYDQGTEDVLQRLASREARRILPIALHQIVARKLAMLNAARFVEDLRVPPGNRLEKLKGTLNGYVSIRINGELFFAGQTTQLRMFESVTITRKI